MPEYHSFPWRVGRKVGRTIYAIVSRGVMDTRALAAEAVEAHNAHLGWVDPRASEEPKP